jgi:hypothetical protein
MTVITVWLLTLSSWVYGGEVTSVQPQMYPTLQDCEQVGKYIARIRSNDSTTWRCVQTKVLVP